MSQVITILGNGQAISAGTIAANVAFANCSTSTFSVSNAGNGTAFVGIFNAPPTNFHHPIAGDGSGNGVCVLNGESRIISGNFKANIDNTVYVAAITPSGSATVYFTPVIGY